MNENEIRFGKLLLDPSINPAVLDTATWEPGLLGDEAGVYLYLASGVKATDKAHIFLGKHGNGQHALVCFRFTDGEIDYVNVETEYLRAFVYERPDVKGPRALGPIPRLGIGSRMTTAAWPGVYRAMIKGGFAANPIQNSMRELHLLDDLKEGTVPPENYAPNVGTIVSGHTGSTWEGLWLYGVIEALKTEGGFQYGADADHIQVKRGEGTGHARQVISAAKNYTFFTLDVSDLVDYNADIKDRFTNALEAASELVANHINLAKNGEPYDLEIAIDEPPAGKAVSEYITTDEELLHLIKTAKEWGFPLTHIAPNWGIEKEFDYRCPDGLEGLAERVKRQTQIAKDNGIMLDFHSGDDLSKETRQIIGEAADGYLHFKVSPRLQLMFAETLAHWDSTLLNDWVRETVGDMQYSSNRWDARQTIKLPMFRQHAFAWVGQRDKQGRYVNRHRFYELSDEFYAEYQDRVTRYLLELQGDLGL